MYSKKANEMPEFRDILDFGAMLSSTVFFQPRFFCRKKNMSPMIAAAYFVEQRSFQSIILGFIIVTSRERERQI